MMSPPIIMPIRVRWHDAMKPRAAFAHARPVTPRIMQRPIKAHAVCGRLPFIAEINQIESCIRLTPISSEGRDDWRRPSIMKLHGRRRRECRYAMSLARRYKPPS